MQVSDELSPDFARCELQLPPHCPSEGVATRKLLILVFPIHHMQFSPWLVGAIIVVLGAAALLVTTPFRGMPQPMGNVGEELSPDSPVVERCIRICKGLHDINVDLSSGRCLSNNLSGYSCAVVSGGLGHCPSYRAGGVEIVLNSRCEFVGVYAQAGGAE